MTDLEWMQSQLLAAPFKPYLWDGEDMNIRAFQSKDTLVEWYCQPPGEDGQPYRDRGFYCRELAHLSRMALPLLIVEFGTSLGIGTCLLKWMNPHARVVTVDNRTETYMPGDMKVPIGCLARFQKIRCEYVTADSKTYERNGVDLCFIDADHSYDAVVADSHRAWMNKSILSNWAIAWHDHNNRHPGVMKAVAEFCAEKDVELRSRHDSDTVWIEG